MPEFFSGWDEVRLDIDPACKPDLIGDITDMKTAFSRCYDAVWSSHNIEHLRRHQVPLALAEFYRVLRPGGRVMISCPDLQSVMQFAIDNGLETKAYESPAGTIRPIDMIFGHSASIADGNEFMAHRTGFTAEVLTRLMLLAGFCNVTVVRDCASFSLSAKGDKPNGQGAAEKAAQAG